MSTVTVFSRHRVIALVAAGVVAGAAGGVVISQLGVATASTPSPSPSAGAPGTRGELPLRPGLGGGPGPLGLLAGVGPGAKVLHGEATLAKRTGGTTVMRFQSGVISAIDGSTMTVKSTDGYTATYTVNGTTRIVLNGTDGTLSKLAKDDKVRVLAVQDGSSTVAKAVLDGVGARGLMPGMHRGLGLRFDHRERMQQPPGGTAGETG